MVLKKDRLLTCIRDLQKLITADPPQDQFFQQINQDLDEIVDDLSSEKLAVHLLSVDRELANSFYYLLDPSEDLEQKYQFRLQELPNHLL
ncbi:MAG: hypothetical protein LH702_20430 [Phormidesmis sp. CAN_BIN44]|nr:hypothetical protein [Phormidesmis sp. CAN_BIN44]